MEENEQDQFLVSAACAPVKSRQLDGLYSKFLIRALPRSYECSYCTLPVIQWLFSPLFPLPYSSRLANDHFCTAARRRDDAKNIHKK